MLTDKLVDWRDPRHWDVGENPSEEKVLQQFLYSAITAFIEENWAAMEEVLNDPEGDYDRLLNAFIDQYSTA